MKEKMAEFLNALMGFRKFIAWIGVFAISILFLIYGYINGSEWTDLMKTAFTAFVAGNGIEYVATTVKDHLANRRAQIDQSVTHTTLKTTTPAPQDDP